MGVLYNVFPLSPDIVEWLDANQIAHPQAIGETRNPTPGELRKVLQSLTGIHIEYDVRLEYDLSANIGTYGAFITTDDTGETPWTQVNVSDYAGEHQPHHIWFDKGWPSLILRILIKLTALTGPLLLVPDTRERPVVVTSTDTVVDLLQQWDHTRGLDNV